MATYIPPQPAQYSYPQYDEPQKPQGPSNASMKYDPNYYPPPPPPNPGDQSYSAPPSRSRGPSIGNREIPVVPPVPSGYAQPQQELPVVQRHIQIAYPNNAPYPDDGYMQPPAHSTRRASASSTHSRHSHDSPRRSHDSHRSHHSKHSSTSQGHERRSNDRDHSQRRPSHSSHTQDEDLKRLKSPPRSFGGSLYSVFGIIKDALGPRDK